MRNTTRFLEPHPWRDGIAIALVVLVSAVMPLLYLWNHAQSSLFAELKNSLRDASETYALLVNGDVHQTLTRPEQESEPAYQDMVRKLRQFKEKNPRLAYVYTMILDRENKVRFVLDTALPGDADGDGVDDHSYLMEEYETPTDGMLRALRTGTSAVDDEAFTDRWGAFLSGYAPIFNSEGTAVGILGVDMRAENVVAAAADIRRAVLLGVGLALVSALAAGAFIWSVRTHALRSRQEQLLTQRRREETELRFRQMFEQMPIGVMYFDRDLRILDYNSKLSATCRCRAGMGSGGTASPCYSENILAVLRDTMAGKPGTYIGPCCANQVGSLSWVEVHAAPAQNSQGEIIGGIATFEDISERYRTSALADAEKQLLDLITQGASIENILAGLVKTLEQLLPGALCSILLLDEDKRHLRHGAAPSLPEAYNQAVDGVEVGPENGSCGSAVYTGEVVIAGDIQTHPYWVNYRALAAEHGLRACISKPIKSGHGDVMGTFAIYYRQPHEPGPEELSLLDRAGFLAGIALERIGYEQTLARERNLLRTLIDNMPDVIFIKDRHHRYLAANQAAAKFLGVAREGDLVGKSDADLFPAATAAAVHQVEQNVLAGKNDVNQESTLVNAQGQTTYLSFSRMPLRNNRGQIIGLITIGRDITDQRHVEEERIKTQKLESLGLLAGGIAHDFNNILTSILGNISMLKSDQLHAGEARELIHEAETAVARARELTQQLLTFAKGGQPIKKPCSVGGVIRESASLAVRGSASRLKLHLDEHLWPADIDPGQISQVVQNLILNADQAMPGGGEIEITGQNIQLPAGNRFNLSPGPYLHFAVRDHGCGIAPEIIEKIFDPYFTTKPEGNGLGLTSSFSIIKKHGGHIVAESTPGKGSTFTFLIPALPDAKLAEAKAETSAPPVGHARILIMDDEEAILKLCARIMELAGYEAATAKNGREAIEKYEAAMNEGRPFDLVLLDLTIPGGMGGKETFECLRRINPSVRAVVSSGYSMDDIMSRYELFGFCGVISKPYHREDLIKAINEALKPVGT